MSAGQGGEAFGGFAGDQGFEAGVQERGLLGNAGHLTRPLKKLVVDDESGSHVHQYA